MDSRRIGIDLDHTIADYRGPLVRLCAEHGLDPAGADPKILLRDTLRAAGREREWTAIQGELYGPMMAGAVVAPGFGDFLERARDHGFACVIISHRSRRPILGADHDLHAIAAGWLATQGLGGLVAHFEETRAAKLARIVRLRPAVFIDDLPEVLLDPAFPEGTRALRYVPAGGDGGGPLAHGDWEVLGDLLFG